MDQKQAFSINFYFTCFLKVGYVEIINLTRHLSKMWNVVRLVRWEICIHQQYINTSDWILMTKVTSVWWQWVPPIKVNHPLWFFVFVPRHSNMLLGG